MDTNFPKQEHLERIPLPFSSLSLLVPPVRLMSAFKLRIVQQKDVMQYGMLADFISLVSEADPELVSHNLGVQLILGLHAKTLTWLDPLLPVFKDCEEFNCHSDHLKTLQEPWTSRYQIP